MKETDLGEEVVAWLAENKPEWKVYQEISVRSSKVADIVCVRKVGERPVVWVIELKTSLTTELIRQACEWDVSYRSIAFPKAKSVQGTKNQSWWALYVWANMGLGVLRFRDRYGIQEFKEPPSRQPQHFKHRDQLLKMVHNFPEAEMAKAGTKHGGQVTPYRVSMEKIKEFLRENPGSGSGDIVKALGKLHYASEHSARGAIGRRLKTIETAWCRTDSSGYYDQFYVRKTNEEI